MYTNTCASFLLALFHMCSLSLVHHAVFRAFRKEVGPHREVKTPPGVIQTLRTLERMEFLNHYARIFKSFRINL